MISSFDAVPRGVVGALLAIAMTTPAEAHRLDEMLQATQVALGEEQLRVTVYLTAGAEVAEGLLARIDQDGDGRLSANELQRFATGHLSQVSLVVDGAPAVLKLDDAVFATADEMRKGTGAIRLSAAVEAPGRGAHALRLVNNAAPVASVYQVNVLQPASEHVSVVQQVRDPEQRTLRVEYTVRSVQGIMASAVIWMPMVTGMALLAFRAAGTFRES